MKSLASRILTSVLILSSCAATAQHPPGSPPEIRIEPVGPRKFIPEASFTNRLAWAGISLINPESSRRPVPLYGYRISDLYDSRQQEDGSMNDILSQILSEAASGGINIVMVTPPSGDDGGYIGQVLRVPRELEGTDILSAWSDFNDVYNDRLIALPRPLSDDLVDRPTEEWRFMANAGIWGPN